MYHFIEYHVKERVASITLNRPEKRNAFNAELVEELKKALRSAENDESVKVILLKANGKVFSAGADLAYLQSLQDFSYEENVADSSALMELYRYMYTHPKIIVGQIQGHAIAGGCGLATVCDFSFAADHAKFGYTEVKIGFVPAIVMVFLLRKIGEGAAKSLLLTGDLITAEQAQKMGLINETVPAEALDAHVQNFVQTLCTTASAEALHLTKNMIAQVQEMSLDQGLQYAAQTNAKARQTADCKAGIQAFLDKQKLTW